jgi:hypothetical protein
MKKLVLTATGAILIVLLLFDVDIDIRFVMPHAEERVDPQQEAAYEACVEEFDRQVHAETFARVDNPDVQRELLYRRMAAAKADCRERYPRRTTTVEVPFDFNFIDLSWRY